MEVNLYNTNKKYNVIYADRHGLINSGVIKSRGQQKHITKR